MLTKPFIIALLVSISLNCLFGYLSYSFYGDKTQAEQAFKTADEANKSLEDSLVNKETACKATDSIVAEYQAEKQEIVGDKQTALNDLDKIVSLPKKEKKVVNEVLNAQQTKEQSSIASLDDSLPADVVSLLSESCSKVRGETCSHP